MLAAHLADALHVLAAKQVQGSVVLRASPGVLRGKLRVHAALSRLSSRQDLQVDGHGWRGRGDGGGGPVLQAFGSQLVYALGEHRALGQGGSRVEDLPALGAAALTLAVFLVPVALDTSQAVRMSTRQRCRVLQGVQAYRADKGLLF